MVDNIIQSYNNDIQKLEREKEALIEFNNVLNRSKDSFLSVNKNRKLVLSQLDAIKSNNKTANGYQEGMYDSLSGVGEVTVSLAFGGLAVSIGLKILQYNTNINNLKIKSAALSVVNND